jgi:hypothetical protein
VPCAMIEYQEIWPVSILCPSVMNRYGLLWIFCNGLSSKWLILLFALYNLQTTDQKVWSSNLSGRTRNHKRIRLVASMALGGFSFQDDECGTFAGLMATNPICCGNKIAQLSLGIVGGNPS